MVDWFAIKDKKKNELIEKINSIINQVELERCESLWSIEQLEIVRKEFSELKMMTENGDFKIGKGSIMLESTYIITDSIKPLNSTTLGKQILLFQELLRKK